MWTEREKLRFQGLQVWPAVFIAIPLLHGVELVQNRPPKISELKEWTYERGKNAEQEEEKGKDVTGGERGKKEGMKGTQGA